MRIDIDTRDLNRVIARLAGYSEDKVQGVKQVIVETAAQIESNAITLAPVDQGNLKNSMFVAIRNSGFTADISNSASYAPFVEWGSRPHQIKAKNAKVLTDGTNFFGKVVNHPGTKAQPFLFPAFQQEEGEYKRRLMQELRDV